MFWVSTLPLGVPSTCVVSGNLDTSLVTKVPSTDWSDLHEEKKNLSPVETCLRLPRRHGIHGSHDCQGSEIPRSAAASIIENQEGCGFQAESGRGYVLERISVFVSKSGDWREPEALLSGEENLPMAFLSRPLRGTRIAEGRFS